MLRSAGSAKRNRQVCAELDCPRRGVDVAPSSRSGSDRCERPVSPDAGAGVPLLEPRGPAAATDGRPRPSQGGPGQRTAGQGLERSLRDPQQSPERDHRQAFTALGRLPLPGQAIGGGAPDAQDLGPLLDGQEARQQLGGGPGRFLDSSAGVDASGARRCLHTHPAGGRTSRCHLARSVQTGSSARVGSVPTSWHHGGPAMTAAVEDSARGGTQSSSRWRPPWRRGMSGTGDQRNGEEDS